MHITILFNLVKPDRLACNVRMVRASGRAGERASPGCTAKQKFENGRQIMMPWPVAFQNANIFGAPTGPHYMSSLSRMAALSDVLWLLADNGFEAELVRAVGVNREAWTDSRLLRSTATRYASPGAKWYPPTRLAHACHVNDYARVVELAPYVNPRVATDALYLAARDGKCGMDIIDVLISAQADVNAALGSVSAIDVKKDDGDVFFTSNPAVIRALCALPAVTRATALQCGIRSRNVDVVRANAVAGMAQWLAEYSTRYDPINFRTYLLGDVNYEEDYFHPGRGVLVSEAIKNGYIGPLDELPTSGSDSAAICRLLLAPPIFTCTDAVLAAGHFNDAQWFEAIVTTQMLANVLARGDVEEQEAVMWAACAVGHLQSLERLLLAGVSPNAYSDQHNELAVCAAARRGHHNVVRLLAECVYINRHFLLRAACAAGLPDAVAHAIDRGALEDNFLASDALMAAIRGGHVDIVRRLFDDGIDALTLEEEEKGSLRLIIESALRAPVFSHRGATVSTFQIYSLGRRLYCVEAYRALLDAGADPQRSSRVLLNAAMKDEVGSVVKELHSRAYDPEQRVVDDSLVIGQGATPLIRAAQYGCVGAVRALLAHGVQVNATAHKLNHTALHVAGEEGHADCVAALLEAGADVDAVDANGRTVWDLSGLAVRRVLRPGY